MKKISCGVGYFLLTLFFIFVLIFNCALSASNQEAILGKWEFMREMDKGETAEFLKNGKFMRTYKGDINQGTYEFLDDNRLTVSSFYGMWEVKINNGELSLKQLDKINKGEIWKFKRIK